MAKEETRENSSALKQEAASMSPEMVKGEKNLEETTVNKEKEYSLTEALLIKAPNGNVEAQFFLGYAYYYGLDIEQSNEKAVEWWQKAAEQGYAEAQYYLGCCYDSGTGIERNYEKAIEWWQKAADQGFEKAKTRLNDLPKI